MADVRRNEPCPCGSGRKYKHCCWGHEEPNHVEPDTVDPVDASEDVLGGRAIHPYAVARFAANPPPAFLKTLTKREIAATNERWSMAKVACLHTDDILRGMPMHPELRQLDPGFQQRPPECRTRKSIVRRDRDPRAA
jgi:hypothetical protein